MKRIAGLILLLGLLFPYSAMAASDGAGCGVGAVLLSGSKGTVMHILAAFINDQVLPQTSSMTTGIAGCDTGATIKVEEARKDFVVNNLDNITQDMAQGEGQYLDSLSVLMGCQGDADFGKMAQEKYEVLTASPTLDAETLVEGLKAGIEEYPQLTAVCTTVS